MSERELVPLSIRLNDSSIALLKQESRRLSYETKADVTYVDLIRDAVKMYIARIEPNAIEDIQVDEIPPHLTVKSAKIDDILASSTDDELLSMFGFIANNPIVSEIAANANQIVRSKSLATIVLGEAVKNQRQKRDPSTIVSTISRRGAVPDQIQEGEGFVPDTFEIACNPTIRIKDLFSRDAGSIGALIAAGADAISKEETTNLYFLLAAASESSEEVYVENNLFTLEHLHKGYQKLLKHGHKAHNIIMSPTAFITLSEQANQQKGNWEFGQLADDHSVIGHFYGASIRTSERFPDHEIFFLADPRLVGGFIKNDIGRALLSPDPSKLRTGIIIWVEIGMFANHHEVTRVVLNPEPKKTARSTARGFIVE